jgi:hypothetical protein
MKKTRFHNEDTTLQRAAETTRAWRRASGLEGLVGGLTGIVINAEPARFESATAELMATTGLDLCDAFEDDASQTAVLADTGTVDVLVQCRKNGPNPFEAFNQQPESKKLPNTRIETLIFTTEDIDRYLSIERAHGSAFLTGQAIAGDGFRFVETPPSPFTGTSTGLIERRGRGRVYRQRRSRDLNLRIVKPDRAHLHNVKGIDHLATRLQAASRDAAIIECMRLTNYNFEFSIYVESMNSITNVTRCSKECPALVFTAGISEYDATDEVGPTEKFVRHYGARVHHIAFATEHIEETYDALARDGMRYLVELVGSREEGLKQTFTVPSRETMLVTEYIHRYDDFDGFFTKSNVTLLTAASDYTPSD